MTISPCILFRLSTAYLGNGLKKSLVSGLSRVLVSLSPKPYCDLSLPRRIYVNGVPLHMKLWCIWQAFSSRSCKEGSYRRQGCVGTFPKGST